MAQTHEHRCNCWPIMLTIGLVSIGMGMPALAQITPDNSLGAERSEVNRNATVQGRRVNRIEGGARRGANLFHSFSEFNVNKGQRVYFANPSGVENILGRVTGNDISEILGTLGVDGTANLFLLNPNGIVFGDTARLDVQGSFIASTANSLLFEQNFAFSAVNPEAPPLLTVSAPIGLQFGSQPGAISSQAVLEVNPERSLILAGGELSLDNSLVQIRSSIRGRGGRIDLAAMAGEGTVALNSINQIFSLSLPEGTARGDIAIQNRSDLSAIAGDGGDIAIYGRNLDISGKSRVLVGIATGQGTAQSQSGDVVLDATAAIDLSEQSLVSNSVNPENPVFSAAVGNSGNIRIRARALSIASGAQVADISVGQGNAGNVLIAVRDRVVVDGVGENGSSAILSRVNPGAIGNGGNIQISAGSLQVSNGAQLIASTQGEGDAGNVIIQARNQVVFNNGATFSRVAPGAIGNAGDIRISADSLQIRNGGQLQANTESQGNAGNVVIQARDRVELSGGRADGFRSNIFSSVEEAANGEAGNIQITTRLLSITDEASLFAKSANRNYGAGDIIIHADRLQLDQGQINAETVAQTGGNIDLAIFDSIRLENDSRITASTQFGQGGNIAVNVGNAPVFSVALEGSLIAVQSEKSGDAGDLTLNVRQLTVQDSDITASTRSGTGGDVLLQGLETLQMNRSRIAASTQTGEAGSLTVNANRLVKLGNRSQLSVEATGNNGQAGDLTINTSELVVQEDAAATVSSRAGLAGNLTVNANRVFLNQGGLTAETAVSQDNQSGANLILNDLELLQMRNGSLLSAEAIDNANGGNVTIDAANGFVIAAPNQNNNIVANAEQGNGGEIQITTQGIFGFEEGRTTPPNLTNDIDASSQFGVQGTVTINQPNVDPSRGLTELPTDVIDLANQINQVCPTPTISDQPSEFIVTGRGGLPPNPTTPLSGEALLADWVTLEPGTAISEQSTVSASDPLLVEAQGWQIGAQGEVIFVAHVPDAASTESSLDSQRHSSACP